MPTIYKPENIDEKKFTFGKITSFKMGTNECKKIMVNYMGKPIHIMGAKMYNTYGLSQFPKKEDCNSSTKAKYHLNLEFKGFNDNFEKHETVGKLYQCLDKVDMQLVSMLLENSGDILDEAVTDYSVINDMYKKIISNPSNAERPPFFKLKLPTEWNNNKMFKKTIDMFNANDNKNALKLDPEGLQEYLKDRKWMRPVIKFDCIYYINGCFYPSLEAHMIKYYDLSEEELKELNNERSKFAEKNKGNGNGKKPKKKNQTMDEFI